MCVTIDQTIPFPNYDHSVNRDNKDFDVSSTWKSNSTTVSPQFPGLSDAIRPFARSTLAMLSTLTVESKSGKRVSMMGREWKDCFSWLYEGTGEAALSLQLGYSPPPTAPVEVTIVHIFLQNSIAEITISMSQPQFQDEGHSVQDTTSESRSLARHWSLNGRPNRDVQQELSLSIVHRCQSLQRRNHTSFPHTQVNAPLSPFDRTRHLLLV